MSQDEILTSVEGSLGVITLNRPKAVNALTHDMIGQLDRALTEFESNDDVHAVLVQGAGDRGLCSGGDVVSIHDNAINMSLQDGVYFLANAPESVGKYMALTGSHVSGPDAVYAGMADVHVPDDHVNALIERLQTITDPGQVDEALADFDQPGGSLLSTESPWINY